MDTPINLSATVPDAAVDTDTGAEALLPELTAGEGDFLISTVDPILQVQDVEIPSKRRS
jgi:hypothetical protein